MTKKKATYKPRLYESNTPKDIFVGMYGSMLMSSAFMDLSKPQQILLLFMRFHIYESVRSKEKTPRLKYKEDELFQDNKYFFFSKYYWHDKYKLYTNPNQFYKDKKALVEHGFIQEVANGKTQKVQTVYAFIDDWKTWEKKN